jgi:hypothetical protein
MQPREIALLVYASCLALTVACGGAAFWLAIIHDKFAEPLFNTLLGLFSFGTGAIFGLIGSYMLNVHQSVSAVSRATSKKAEG